MPISAPLGDHTPCGLTLRRRLPHLLLLGFALSACKPVEEAPEDVDEMIRAWWLGWVEADDDEITALADQSIPIIDPVALAEASADGTQSRLTEADLRVVEHFAPPDDDGSWQPPDPALARPYYLLNRYRCSIDQLERILSWQNQGEIFDYDAYERTFTSSAADFHSGEASTLTWTVDLEGSYVGFRFTEHLLGGIRRVPLTDTEQPFGADRMLITRTWIPYPARFRSDGPRFDQDYQIEVFIPWGDDEILHIYGVWRELQVAGFSAESDGLARIMINALKQWDEETEKLCEEGRP